MATVTVCPSPIPGGCDFVQISAAVASGADLILVSAGTYNGWTFGSLGITQQVEMLEAGVIVNGAVAASGTTVGVVDGFGDTVIAAGCFASGTGRLTISGCVINGTGFASSCCWASGNLTLEACTISTASATYGILADGTGTPGDGEITINGGIDIIAVGARTGALRIISGGIIHLNSTADISGPWANALLAESGTVSGDGIINCIGGTTTTGINCTGATLSFGTFNFSGTAITTGTGIRCSAGSVEIETSGSLDKVARGVHTSGTGITAIVNRMTFGSSVGHQHAVFAESASRVELYGCTIANCIGQASFDGSAVIATGGSHIIFDTKESENGVETLVNEISDCVSVTNQDGGAIALNASTMTAYALRISNCNAQGTGSGGGIRIENASSMTLGRLVEETDGATGENGALSYAGWDPFDTGRVDQGGVSIEGCQALDGGAISSDSSTYTLVNVALRDNTARRT